MPKEQKTGIEAFKSVLKKKMTPKKPSPLRNVVVPDSRIKMAQISENQEGGKKYKKPKSLKPKKSVVKRKYKKSLKTKKSVVKRKSK